MFTKRYVAVLNLFLVACIDHQAGTGPAADQSSPLLAPVGTVEIGEQRYLPVGTVVPRNTPITAPPQPFDRRHHTVAPNPLGTLNLAGRPGVSTPRRYPTVDAQVSSSSSMAFAPPPGNGDIAITLRDSTQNWSGVFQMNHVGYGIDLPQRAQSQGTGYIYAPTLLPPGHTCIEVATVHLRAPGATSPTQHRQGWYDWCQPGTHNHEWNVWVDTENPDFINRYVRYYNAAPTIAIVMEEAAPCWYSYLYDYSLGSWTLAYSSCPNPVSYSPGAYNGLYGWTAWESWDVVGPGNCPVFPNLHATNIQFANPVTFTWQPITNTPLDAYIGGGVVDCWTNFGNSPYTLVFPATGTGLPVNSWLAQTSPAVPFQVWISGPTTVGPNNYNCSVWVANQQGGVAPVEYSWSGLSISTDYFATGTVPQTGGELLVIVTDSRGWQTGGGVQISYDPSNQDYCQ